MIGRRLKELRTGRRMSLRALASETGLSATLLSQVERGVTEPSLSTLRRLASVFDEPVGALFDDPDAPSVWISRPGQRSTIKTPSGHIYERISTDNGQVGMLRGVLDPSSVSSDALWSHPSIECGYVVAGTLTVEVRDASYTVRAGETITLDARQPHRYRNATDEPVEYILAVSPPTP